MISEALLRFGGHRAVEEALLDISSPLLSARRRGKIDARNFVSIFSTILEGRENRGAARCRTRAKVRELRGSYERHIGRGCLPLIPQPAEADISGPQGKSEDQPQEKQIAPAAEADIVGLKENQRINPK